ncbi:NACHT domain-containing protein [Streptomyces botrytidirepellens]|uniref:ATP-binding protein n=1 Tax=Streptomyces botrytidirepellens TaxID=2486417 RepID=A0A3M8W4I8_9ACTN|nr:ATP-binding protein [Streptomyces botrytidirepellens]RNG23571.1 ATP-binding protein [Streptomyces botrytidirepellens]
MDASAGPYLYERLTEKNFQRLCNALLASAYSDVQCYPVGHSDGGRDATRHHDGRLIIYQVKWTSKPQQSPVTWLNSALEGEADNIRRLVKEGAEAYYLMTSVAGTATPRRGSMDKMDSALAKHSAAFGIPIHIWWRADIDARVDAAPTELKWAYSDMLAGHDLVRYLIDGADTAAHDHALRTLVMKVIATQWDEDAKVKFKQVELTSHNLNDLFIDVEAIRLSSPLADHRVAYEEAELDTLGGAADYLLTTRQPFTLVRGEPGQGKSTLGQYLSQLHRAAYLAHENTDPAQPSTRELINDPRLPLRIDLRDYAAWLAGIDPFSDEDRPPRRRLRKQGSLEEFIACLLTARSGGLPADTTTVHDILERLPVLIVLDGLDEVARSDTRQRVVDEIDSFTARLRSALRPQVIVTTRPNVAGLAEPRSDRFETIALTRLNESLRTTYLRKWAQARSIPDKERRNLERIFRQRSAEPHISQLADNPMQLTILLYLMHKRGNSVPANRTDLYSSYMETFLDREAEKTAAVDEHRSDLEEVTSFLGWHLQARAEQGGGNGQLPTKELRRAILNYLFDVEKETNLVDDLFTAVTDRVWALTSKVQGTFEFDVQPLREYFAARYLYDFAGADQPQFDKADVLRHLVRRGYWLNTSRFFAGFAKPNELSGLVETLEEERDEGTRPRQTRLTAWFLLADGVFSARTRSQRRAADLFLDDLSVRFINHELRTSDDLPVPSPDRGGKHLVEQLLASVAQAPRSRAAVERRQLATWLLEDPEIFRNWWHPHMRAVLGTDQEDVWLRIGSDFQCANQLAQPELDCLALADVSTAAAALQAGLIPPHGSLQEEQLVRAVLDGHTSELDCPTTSYASDLLCVLRPQYLLHKASGTNALHNLYVVGHSVPDLFGRPRLNAFTRLKERDPRFHTLQPALKFSKGQRHTTSPWGNTARAVKTILGPCWLAAEIAVIGAAAQGFTTGGDITHGSQPLGADPDYGRLILELRLNRSATAWWAEQFATHTDALSRATWVLGLIAVADETVVTEHLPRIDEAISALPPEMQQALCMSSSRLGASLVARRLSDATLPAAATCAPLTALLITHYVIAPEGPVQQLQPLSNDILTNTAPFGSAAWPALLALTARMTHAASPTNLEGLRAHGPHGTVRMQPSDLPSDIMAAILASPFDYPMAWVMAADRAMRSDSDQYLANVATDGKWFSA